MDDLWAVIDKGIGHRRSAPSMATDLQTDRHSEKIVYLIVMYSHYHSHIEVVF